VTALFILKHFPTLLLIRVVIFGLTVPKLCQILLLNRGCARIQRHLIGLAVHLLQGLSLHLQFHLNRAGKISKPLGWNPFCSSLASIRTVYRRLRHRQPVYHGSVIQFALPDSCSE